MMQRLSAFLHSRKHAVAMIAAGVAALLLIAPATMFGDNGKGNAYGKNKDYPYGINQSSSRAYAIGLWGDLPYSAAQAAALPALLADMNSQDLAFTAHDGDLRQGSGAPSCVEGGNSIYQNAIANFNTLKAAAVFTPGDNDWTDCDRASLGANARNSLQELDNERATFFPNSYTLGQNQFLQEVQSEPLCKGFLTGTSVPGVVLTTQSETFTYKDVACVENRRWIVGKVMYVTLNVQGSCNNLCDDYPDAIEYAARNAANIAWLQGAFSTAKEQECVAVMIISQADPGFDGSDGTRAPLRDPMTLAQSSGADGYKTFLVALRNEVLAFGKPVAFVHGDSHYFRVDKPLQDVLGRRIPNFTRVESFGDNATDTAPAKGPSISDVNWVKVLVDPSSREVFSFQPQMINHN